jgi:hypothetical protein
MLFTSSEKKHLKHAGGGWVEVLKQAPADAGDHENDAQNKYKDEAGKGISSCAR